MKRTSNGIFRKFIPYAGAAAFLLPVFCVSGCSEKNGPEDTPVSKYASVYSDNANMPCDGIIMAEFGDSPAGSDISKIIDGDPSTSFVTYRSDFDVTFTGNSGSGVNEYSLIASGSEAPKDWTLFGSNNDKDWTELDSQSGQTFSDGETKTYALAGESYKSYRLSVTANNGSSSTAIAEWMLSAEEVTEIRVPLYELPAMSTLIQYSDPNSWSYSDETPMGKHYAGLHVTTDADRAWLADPSTDIEIPVAAGGVDEGSASWSTPTFQLYPAGDPRPADVNQHGIGDCCLCAALASMAYIYPDFIKQEVIKAKGNGVYDIAMYDPQGNPVTVSVTTSCLMNNGSIVAVSGKDNVATWATLLEKAVMKWNVIYQKSPSLGGIGTEIVPPLFTGNGGSIAYGAGQLNAQQLDEVVDIMLENGAIVVGGFTTSNITITPGPFYTVNGHAYTLMWSPDPDALFIMRNPWGSAAGSPDGKEDGAMDILDDGIIPPLIDLRIVEPGAAAPYMENPLLPYTPPQFSAGSFWLTPQLMKYYNL